MIGSTLGSYRIVEQIGMGGMATVYKAYDAGTDRYVAVKVLPHQYSSNPTFVERFKREAKAIAKLEHPYILPVHAYGEDQGTAFLVMRYMDAGTLGDRVKQGALPLDEATRLVRQIGDALDYAHQNGILHRDVKPSNVLLDSNNNAYLMDFGIAKILEGMPDLTGTGLALGTPQYMSPEQCMGVKDLTPAMDVYALGVVLYQMVTGRLPFQAETPLAVIHQQLNDPLPPPRSVMPSLPEGVERVILKSLAKQPEDRYQSCGDMATALEKAIAGEEIPAPPSTRDQLDATIPDAVGAPEAAPVRPIVSQPVTPAPAPTPMDAVPSPIFDERPQGGKIPVWVFAAGGGLLLVVCLVVVVAVVGVGMFGGGGAAPEPTDAPRRPTDVPGSESDPTDEPEAEPTAAQQAEPTEAASVPPVVVGGACDPRSTQIEANRVYSENLTNFAESYPDNCLYYCLWIPDGAGELTVSIADFDIDLDVYVGYSEITSVMGAETSEYGWYSNDLGTGDESVTIGNPESSEAYYIEVCPYFGEGEQARGSTFDVDTTLR
jgi:serine/threonine-protein kinase